MCAEDHSVCSVPLVESCAAIVSCSMVTARTVATQAAFGSVMASLVGTDSLCI